MNNFSKRLAAELERLKDENPDILATPYFGIESPACQTCNDLGVISLAVPTDDPRFGKLYPCDNPECMAGNQQRQRVYTNRYKSAKIPDLYAGLTFDSWRASLSEQEKQGKVLAYCAAYLFGMNREHYMSRQDIYELAGMAWDGIGTNRPKNSLCFYGAVGTGKTGLASAAANVAMDSGQTVLYSRVMDIIEAIKSRFKADEPPTAEDVVRDFSNAPLLWIDEFNVNVEGEWRQEQLESIMRARYANRLPTLMTTNLTQDEFRKHWGERTSEAVLAMAHWIPLSGLKIRETERPLVE